MIRLYDGNNHVRRRIETDPSGLTLRNLYADVQLLDGVHIYVWDGPRSNSARREIYPDYKMNRSRSAEDIQANLNLFRKLLSMSRAIQVEVPGFEADDVIAALTNRYKPTHKIHIHSNDGDFVQLGVPLDRELFKVEPHLVRLYKTFVGDPADNIPGAKKFGKGAWAKADHKALAGWASNDFDSSRVPTESLPPATLNWINTEQGIEKLRVYWKIVGFLPVPDQLIDDHTKIGVPCPEEAYKIMSEFLV